MCWVWTVAFGLWLPGCVGIEVDLICHILSNRIESGYELGDAMDFVWNHALTLSAAAAMLGFWLANAGKLPGTRISPADDSRRGADSSDDGQAAD